MHLLPQLRNPFAETTAVRNQPVILKSITNLSSYEAAQQSPPLSEAQKNTVAMLDGMHTSLGFQRVTVTFGGRQAS